MCPDPSPAEFKPQMILLCCRQALAQDAALESAVTSPKGFSVQQKVIPCSGRIEAHILLQYLARGVDGIEIIACPDGACQHLSGNTRARKRIERARQLLSQAGFAPERIGLDQAANLTAAQVLALVEARVEAVRPLGINPMKGELVQ